MNMVWKDYVLVVKIQIILNHVLFSYSVMSRCWETKPEERPSFSSLKNIMKEMERKHEVRPFIFSCKIRSSDYMNTCGNPGCKIENIAEYSLESVLTFSITIYNCAPTTWYVSIVTRNGLLVIYLHLLNLFSARFLRGLFWARFYFSYILIVYILL